MASVLLACFDSFIGDHKQAIKQIQTEEPVEDEIIQMFTRLAIQAKSYDMAFHFPKPYDPIPEQFDSLHEARIAWDTLCEQMFRFTERLFAQASQDGPMGVLPASLRQYGLSFRGRIEAWADAFEHILSSRFSPGVSSQEKAAIAVLKMSQIMGQVLFLMTFSDSEQHFDVFQPQFKTIVDLGLEVVGDEERRAAEKRCPDPRTCHHHNSQEPDIFGGHTYMANHIKPSFSADLGIVPPLYVVATKCRSPVLRRQAIQLLRSSSRREGMWDSELTARIGTWIMNIEEEEDQQPIMTPGRSPANSFSDAGGFSPQSASVNGNGMSPKPRQAAAIGSPELGDSLGPGGNARWDMRRESTTSSVAAPQRTVSEAKRVMVKAVEFDLKRHSAVLQCGSRSTAAGSPDLKTRVTQIIW
ncbi:putative c6 zinc finger domain protein [Diaporthe ampelina]|uniref:Putative c6 zinc finger domain protein n=1 Tax=Diaporthe ampelina TaxID=1214573 RepID=A0A0G2HP50_9PEZI|nr:putative c6 zinc finger domain protein [Diaporthe ampelina]